MSSTAPSTSTARVAQTAGRTFYTVQALRAIAAAMVVVHHTTVMIAFRLNPSFHTWDNGQAGVDIFFVISGLVMTLSSEPLIGRAHGARTFLLRRVERVVPLYWLITTLKLVLLIVTPEVAVNGAGSVWHAVASYLFLPALGPFGYYPVLIVGWTLNFEMMFYVLFAAALAWRIPLLRFLTPVLCLMSLAPWVLGTHLQGVLVLMNPIVLEFLFGVLLAKALQSGRLPGQTLSAVLVVVGFALLFALPIGPFRALLWGLPALMIVTGAVGLESHWGKRLPKWSLEMGDASYSLYLTHTLVLPAVATLALKLNAGPGRGIWVWMLIAALLCLMAGEVCYRGLELPIIRYFRGRRHTAVPAVAQ